MRTISASSLSEKYFNLQVGLDSIVFLLQLPICLQGCRGLINRIVDFGSDMSLHLSRPAQGFNVLAA